MTQSVRNPDRTCPGPNTAPDEIGGPGAGDLVVGVVLPLHNPLSRAEQTLATRPFHEAEDITPRSHSCRADGGRLDHPPGPGAGVGPLVLGAGGGRAVHRRRAAQCRGALVNAILDLRHEVRRTPVTLDAALTLDGDTRRAAIAEWTGRMVDEQAASRVFAGLLPQMMRAGVDPRFQAAAADAVVDELRHA